MMKKNTLLKFGISFHHIKMNIRQSNHKQKLFSTTALTICIVVIATTKHFIIPFLPLHLKKKK